MPAGSRSRFIGNLALLIALVGVLLTGVLIADRLRRDRPGLGVGHPFSAAQHVSMPDIGDRVPEFSLLDLAGAHVTLAGFRGKTPVVIEFGSFT